MILKNVQACQSSFIPYNECTKYILKVRELPRNRFPKAKFGKLGAYCRKLKKSNVFHPTRYKTSWSGLQYGMLKHIWMLHIIKNKGTWEHEFLFYLAILEDLLMSSCFKMALILNTWKTIQVVGLCRISNLGVHIWVRCVHYCWLVRHWAKKENLWYMLPQCTTENVWLSNALHIDMRIQGMIPKNPFKVVLAFNNS